MSDAQPHEHDAPHEGPIRTPKQLIVAVFFAFVIPIACIVLLVQFVTSDQKPAAGSDGLSDEAVAQRIAPVGVVEVKDLNDPASMKTGEQVFQAQCSACHATGAVGAPKFGDAAAWGPRIGQGYSALLNSALHGKGNMGPQGGGDFSDYEVGRAVVYMANHGGANFPEPVFQPAAAASGPVAAASDAGADAAAAQVAAALKSVQGSAGGAGAGAGAAAGAVPALFTQTCSACHGTGVAGAPKVGDKAAWAPRIAQGIDTLVKTAIAGKGAMPPKGGATNASEDDIRAVVTYMVNAAK